MTQIIDQIVKLVRDRAHQPPYSNRMLELADEIEALQFPSSPGKDGGQEVEAVADSGPVSVPGGWALVPVKMNADMINAWSGGLTVTTDEIAYQTSFQEAWKRVLAAAPSAKAEVDISALVRRLRSLVSYHVSTEIDPKGWTWYVAPDAPEVIMETIDALSATIAARQEVTAEQASNELTRREEAGADARVPLTAPANVARLSNEQLKAIATRSQPASTALVERLTKALEEISDTRCVHDMGFDREIGPLGCSLGDKCVCVGLCTIASRALQEITTKALDGQAVAWRWKWKDCGSWIVTEGEPDANERRIIEPLYKSAHVAEPVDYHIVFDGFPSPDGPRFIEVENAAGQSIKAGEWRKRDDGLCELVIKAGVLKNG